MSNRNKLNWLITITISILSIGTLTYITVEFLTGA